MKRTISIIVPAFNEEECVDELAARLAQVFEINSRYDFEVLAVENGSTDKTWERLKAINQADGRFKVIRLSRNFGMDGGLTAGLKLATSDAVVLMTADLQDPPELITEFIEKWESGYQNIYMEVSRRTGTSLIRALNSRIFYWVAGRLTGNRIPSNASDYRLLDRKVYEVVRKMDERNRFVRGLVAWVGFQSVGVLAERPPRYAGKSNARTFVVLDLAIKGLLSHSYFPLRLISVIGALISITSLASFLVFVTFWLVVGVPFAGFGTIVSLSLLVFGTLSLMLGIVAQYLGLVYEEVKGRPNFVIDEVVGISVVN